MTKTPSIKEAFTQVLASLAAAISILDRTPRSKKAVASDTMFDISLNDYRKALEAGRSALATLQPEGGQREAIARIICCGEKCLLENVEDGKGCLVKRSEGCRSLDRAKLILASGLVQNEAVIRADEREVAAQAALAQSVEKK